MPLPSWHGQAMPSGVVLNCLASLLEGAGDGVMEMQRTSKMPQLQFHRVVQKASGQDYGIQTAFGGLQRMISRGTLKGIFSERQRLQVMQTSQILMPRHWMHWSSSSRQEEEVVNHDRQLPVLSE